MGELIGIDFGTTNSLVAVMEGGRPSVIPNARGSRMTPSVVALSAAGHILVGESARNQAALRPESAAIAVKRSLGDPAPLCLEGRQYRAAELVAFILASLKSDAEGALGRPVDRAVLTIPANSSEPERRALREAGRLAGLEVVRLVNEPTAAALARAWALSRNASRGAGPDGVAANLLVYDFGGGTFDVTILRQEGRHCRVLASRGDGRLGGIDLDRELCAAAAARFREEYGLEPSADPILARMLVEQAERAKIELSERAAATIALPFVPVSSSGGYAHPSFEASREGFEALARPYVERSLELVERSLRDAGLGAAQVDGLILSGGSSRIPLVRRLIAERFGLRPEGGIDPETVVVLGAAVVGAIEASTAEEGQRPGAAKPGATFHPEAGKKPAAPGFRVHDVVSRTYGVEIDSGSFVPLILKNSPVPASRARVFTTVVAGQDSVEVHILQGESPRSAENLSLGRFLLSGIRPAPAGEPRIRVEFRIDESDILHVAARDLDTGQSQRLSIVDYERGAADDSAETLRRKAESLARRLGELSEGLALDASLRAEIEDAAARTRAARENEGAGQLRMLLVELEGLAAELLSRRAPEESFGLGLAAEERGGAA